MYAVTFITYRNITYVNIWLFRNLKLTCVKLHEQMPGLQMAAAPVCEYPRTDLQQLRCHLWFHLTFHAWIGWVGEIKYGLIVATISALTS